ncbi:MAG TPA: trypsin-like peptidase domain-containing protein [Thermoleophilaceae bacterium]
MRSPRHLWIGDWRADSDEARRAAEEAAERHRQAALRGEPVEAPPAPRKRRFTSPMVVAALIGAAIAAGAFSLGTVLTGGSNDHGPAPLAAVSSKPIKPRPGQTRAGAIYAAASPAVVSVRTGQGSGTGFLIDKSGTLVTNDHVVANNDRVIVRFGKRADSIDAKVVGTDPSSDLAVLSIDPSAIPGGVKPLQFADSRAVQVGDTAIAIGNPFGLDRTATEGIVSGLGREIQAPNGFTISEVIQTDAPINPGNSGGPLLDDGGKVIGVNSQIETGGSGGGNVGIGFAVPSNTVRQVVPRLEKGETIKRGYLGISTSAVSPNNPDGARVEKVEQGQPGERGGVQVGDVITKIDGRTVADSSDITAAVSAHAPGDKVKIEIERNGQHKTLTVTLGTRPARTP